jgi:hypothetical protein
MDDTVADAMPDTASLRGIDCPVCGKRAVNTPACSRCGSEMTLLCGIRDGADTFAALAERAIVAMEPSKAADFAERSLRLMKTPRAARAAFLAAVAEGNFDDATARFREAADGPHSPTGGGV